MKNTETERNKDLKEWEEMKEKDTHTGKVLPPAFSRLLGQQSVCLLNNRWCGRLACSHQAHTHTLSALRPELDY